MRDPSLVSPVPKGRDAQRFVPGEKTGLLAYLVRKPRPRSALRLREPRRLPRPLAMSEAARLLASLRTWRDRAIAGLMLYCGLRSCEVLALDVADVDIGRGWIRVWGKGAKERAVPLDADLARVIQGYLLIERPESGSARLFLVAKGPNRGQPLTAAGLRTIFRYHRQLSGVTAGHPHALRHSFGTALVNAGVSLQSLMALLGHVSAQMSLRYGNLFDATARTEYERALTLAKDHLAALPTTPAGTKALPLADITGGADWTDTPALKSRLAGGYCLRAPAQGAFPYANICEHCPNFRTDLTYLPILAAQRADARKLADDAQRRGWITEADRHHKLIARLDNAIADIQKSAG
ncbi:tyrosine-type recombinase/integrase [Nocardia sp. NPDC050630]|uniref:tyrosine-type recombinase/integrase n=1 Tax=Nocardia sp. NPDC050630 TaxID=3364321 RepID=UPI00379A6D84